MCSVLLVGHSFVSHLNRWMEDQQEMVPVVGGKLLAMTMSWSSCLRFWFRWIFDTCVLCAKEKPSGCLTVQHAPWQRRKCGAEEQATDCAGLQWHQRWRGHCWSACSHVVCFEESEAVACCVLLQPARHCNCQCADHMDKERIWQFFGGLWIYGTLLCWMLATRVSSMPLFKCYHRQHG